MARKKGTITRKISRRSVRKPKPMRIAALIVSAIQDLRETKGSTPNKIVGYISYASNMPERRVKRQVKAALKRGVEYGILRRYRGHYFLRTSNELDRANRIAVRFARLPTSDPHSIKTNNTAPRKVMPLKGRKKPRGLGNNKRQTKRLVKARPVLLSPAVSLTDPVCSNELCTME